MSRRIRKDLRVLVFLLIEETLFWRGADILPSGHTLDVLDFALIENLNMHTISLENVGFLVEELESTFRP